MAKRGVADFDTRQWLKEDLGFTDEEIRTLGPQFEKRKDRIAEGYLRQSDYSRMIGEAQKVSQALKAKDDQLNREMAEWATLQAGDEETGRKLRAELEQVRTERFQLEQRINSFAADNGIPVEQIVPKDLLRPGGPPPPGMDPNRPTGPGAPPQGFDPNSYVPRDQFGAVVDYMLTVPAELSALVNEHYHLTGEYLDTRNLIATLKTRVQQKRPADLRQIWEETYKIPELRSARAKERYEADIAAAEERGREAARSEAALPGQHPSGAHAPVFTKLRAPDQGPVLTRSTPGESTRQIAASLASRKYAPGTTSASGNGPGPGGQPKP